MTEGITREQNTTSLHEDEGLVMPGARLAVIAKGQAVQRGLSKFRSLLVMLIDVHLYGS